MGALSRTLRERRVSADANESSHAQALVHSPGRLVRTAGSMMRTLRKPKHSGSEVKAAAARSDRRWMKLGVLATVLGALGGGVALFKPGDSGGSSKTPPQLEKVDLVVDERGPALNPRIEVEVLLRNPGTERSVVNRAVFRVLRATELTACSTQGVIPVSETYEVRLSPIAAPDEIVSVPIDEQLAGDEVDRFAISIGVARAPGNTEAAWRHTYVYALELSLLHDTSKRPLNLGRLLVATPSIPREQEFFLTKAALAEHRRGGLEFTPGFFAETLPCWNANAQKLKPLLELGGARDSEFAQETEHMVVWPGR
jgi:hypothetical protein